MHYTNYKWRRFTRLLLLSLLSLVLAACSTNQAPQSVDTTEFTAIATVDISADADQAELEAMYGGSIVSFKPDAGFAVLGFNEKQAALTTLSTTANQNTFSSPEVSAAGWDAWAGGWDAWAGGWDAWAGGHGAWSGGHGAWSGGHGAWSGGHGAWSGGSSTSGLGANETAWDQIKLEEAHAVSRRFGEGIKVAVIDTGIDRYHPLFEGRLSPQSDWWDYIGNDSDPQEASDGSGRGHGTAVASIILQIAPNATVLPLRVLDANGEGDTDDVVKAIERAVDKGADVINISLGSNVYDDAVFRMAKYANAQGIMIFASSGNNGGSETMTYPGKFSWVTGTYHQTLGIGSVNSQNQMSDFTSYGYGLYAVAPGENIVGAFPGGKSATYKGTSFAAPMFTGAAALALSEMPASADKTGLNYRFWQSLDFSLAQQTGIDGARLLNVEKLIRVLPGFSEPEFQLENVKSGKCLEVHGGSTSNGGNVDQWWCYGPDTSVGKANVWKLKPTNDRGYYQLVNVKSGKVVDITANSQGDGANAQQWSYGGGSNQKWQLKADGSEFSLVAKHSGKCLDVQGGSLNNGANVQQWNCNGTDAQKFRLRLVN